MRKTGTNKECENCGAIFYVPGWRAKDDPKFCSMKCSWEGRKPREKKPQVEVVCEECGGAYFVPQHRADKTRFCSQECGGAAHFRKMHASRRPTASNDNFKVCSDCGLEKSRSEFWERPGNFDGLRGRCKECCQTEMSEWIAKDDNHDRKISADRLYYEREADRIGREAREKYAADPEPMRAQNKKWRDANPEKARESGRRRRIEKPEIVRAERRKHYRENKGTYVANARSREKHIKRATPPWADLKSIRQFYIQAELLTRQTGVKFHVDHIYPLRGKTMCGLHVEDNLQIVPAIVNLAKGNRIAGKSGEPLCCAWPDMSAAPFDVGMAA